MAPSISQTTALSVLPAGPGAATRCGPPTTRPVPPGRPAAGRPRGRGSGTAKQVRSDTTARAMVAGRRDMGDSMTSRRTTVGPGESGRTLSTLFSVQISPCEKHSRSVRDATDLFWEGAYPFPYQGLADGQGGPAWIPVPPIQRSDPSRAGMVGRGGRSGVLRPLCGALPPGPASSCSGRAYRRCSTRFSISGFMRWYRACLLEGRSLVLCPGGRLIPNAVVVPPWRPMPSDLPAQLPFLVTSPLSRVSDRRK